MTIACVINIGRCTIRKNPFQLSYLLIDYGLTFRKVF